MKKKLFEQIDRLSKAEQNNVRGGIDDTLIKGGGGAIGGIGHSCATGVDCWCSSHCFSGPSCTSGWY